MPIRPELRHFYRGPQWKATRARIRERAGGCCEQCGKPDGAIVETVTGRCGSIPVMWWHAPGETQRFTVYSTQLGGDDHEPRYLSWKRMRLIHVVCTVAHLNHTPGDDRDENLVYLCQWCHLNYDKLHHKETRSTRKDAARPLLSELSAVSSQPSATEAL